MNNVEIDGPSGAAKIILDTRFYGYGAVMAAAQEYSESCWVLVDGDKEDKLLVSIKPKSPELPAETAGLEFCNYVLGLMQNAIF